MLSSIRLCCSYNFILYHQEYNVDILNFVLDIESFGEKVISVHLYWIAGGNLYVSWDFMGTMGNILIIEVSILQDNFMIIIIC